ncbi:MAG: PP2C family protein-serine/threonine phosphatase [Planctomycetota bacterium]
MVQRRGLQQTGSGAQNADPRVWQCYTVDQRWVCPFCRSGFKVVENTAAGIRALMQDHLQRHCPDYQRGRGAIASVLAMQHQVHLYNVEYFARNDRAWQVFDHEGYWFSPCSLQRVDSVQLVNRRFDANTVQNMAEHLLTCPHYRQGTVHPVEQVQKARDASARITSLSRNLQKVVGQRIWQHHDPLHNWICPYCLDHIKSVQIAPRGDWADYTGLMAQHLLTDCPVYPSNPRAIRSEREVASAAATQPSPTGNSVLGGQAPSDPNLQMMPMQQDDTPLQTMAISPVTSDLHTPASGVRTIPRRPGGGGDSTPLTRQNPVLPTLAQAQARASADLPPSAQTMRNQDISGSGRTPITRRNALPASRIDRTGSDPAEAPSERHSARIRRSSSGGSSGSRQVPAMPETSGEDPQSARIVRPTTRQSMRRKPDQQSAGDAEVPTQNASGRHGLIDDVDEQLGWMDDESAHDEASSAYHRQRPSTASLTSGEYAPAATRSGEHMAEPVADRDQGWMDEGSSTYEEINPPTVEDAVTGEEPSRSEGTGRTPSEELQWMDEVEEDLAVVVHTKEHDSELIRARDIQLNMLKDSPRVPGFTFDTRYEPAADVSGDFYEFIELDDGRIGFALGDVSGHGMGAGLIMSMAKKVFSIYARMGLQPQQVLSQMNDALVEDLGGKRFISLTYAILDPSERTIIWCRAGHNPTLLFNRHTKELSEIKPPGMVVGMKGGGIFANSIKVETTQLRDGDIFLLYTDGITETMNRQGDEYGQERLQQLLTDHGTAMDITHLLDRMMDSARQFRAGGVTEDDITLLGLSVD